MIIQTIRKSLNDFDLVAHLEKEIHGIIFYALKEP